MRSAGAGEALPGGVSGLCTHVCPGENLFLLRTGNMGTIFLGKAFLSSLTRDFFAAVVKKKGARLSACLLAPDQRF